jgi:hypothetical protein
MIPLISWEEVKRTVMNNEAVGKFPRSKEVDEKYDQHKRQHGDVEAYLMNTLFPDGKSDQEFNVCPNQFPYNMEPGIEHWLVWGNPHHMNAQEFKEQAPTIISDRFAQFECLWCINPVELQSILSIPHAHVFIRVNEVEVEK